MAYSDQLLPPIEIRPRLAVCLYLNVPSSKIAPYSIIPFPFYALSTKMVISSEMGFS